MKNKLFWLIGIIFCSLFCFHFLKEKKPDTALDLNQVPPVETTSDALLDHNKLHPIQVVWLYIAASKTGEENTVKSLGAYHPDTYIENCLENNDQFVAQKSRPTEQRKFDIAMPLTADELYWSPDALEKFSALIQEDAENASAYMEAKYIWASQNAFGEIRLVSANIFGNEAKVDVDYGTPDHTKRIYLLTQTDGGWKVFSTINPESSSFEWERPLYQNFAKPRPLCRKK